MRGRRPDAYECQCFLACIARADETTRDASIGVVTNPPGESEFMSTLSRAFPEKHTLHASVHAGGELPLLRAHTV
jgi:hypothetical protein